MANTQKTLLLLVLLVPLITMLAGQFFCGRLGVFLPEVHNAPKLDIVTQSNSITKKKSTRIGLVVVSDKNFVAKYELLYEKQREYAARHGYEYHLLEPLPSCREALKSFFFQKHCTIREFLSRQEEGYTLFVMDGDMIPAAPEVNLSRWTQDDNDVLLYERGWNFEVTAGNYMVRNTAFGLNFLYVWEQLDFRARSIVGFSSSDNGAIHIALLQVLGIPVQEYVECDRRYQQLRSSVENLSEYFLFVACTRRVLGPNRQWTVDCPVPGKLTFEHRYHGFAADGHVVGRRYGGGIPFHHGEKNPEASIKHYNKTKPWASAEEQSRSINDNYLVASRGADYHSVPRINLTACLPNFSCKPASMHSKPSRRFYQTHNDTVVFEYTAVYGSKLWQPTILGGRKHEDGGTHEVSLDEGKKNEAQHEYDGKQDEDEGKHERVSCGGHYAKTCAACPQRVGAAWCNGECKWLEKEGVCVKAR